MQTQVRSSTRRLALRAEATAPAQPQVRNHQAARAALTLKDDHITSGFNREEFTCLNGNGKFRGCARVHGH